MCEECHQGDPRKFIKNSYPIVINLEFYVIFVDQLLLKLYNAIQIKRSAVRILIASALERSFCSRNKN